MRVKDHEYTKACRIIIEGPADDIINHERCLTALPLGPPRKYKERHLKRYSNVFEILLINISLNSQNNR